LTAYTPTDLLPTDLNWPQRFTHRLSGSQPNMLRLIGPASHIATRKVALFCSAQTPGDAILRAFDAARNFRDKGITVISGFHSPIEKECLSILLRGKQPIIICPARAIETMRIPRELRTAFHQGRILFLSRFINEPKRVTKASAILRNDLAAALADEVYFAHIAPGGEAMRIGKKIGEWGVPELWSVANGS
jgi:predicted Rossmann fold nucleotide-binding protein DprA/Smf involved in DNA uptake